MATAIEICNAALIKLGADTINSFEEDSTEALACKINWPISRKSLLSMHPWNFATIRKTLSAESTAPNHEFKYAYPLPADNLRLIEVYKVYEYRIENNRILTDSEECEIKYIKDDDNPALWPAYFVDLMVARLSFDLAYTFPRARTMLDAQFQLYQQALQTAKFVNSSEDVPETFGKFDDSFIGYRY